MPEISRFFGIVIAMYYDEHEPPHFHARYGEHRAAIAIATTVVIDGNLPPREAGLIRQWAAEHMSELADDWERARTHRPLLPIEPLR